MIGDIRKFKFWCQKVLPLVYDDSLSYYEVLCKLVQYLNNVIKDVNSIPEYIDDVIEEALSDEHLRELINQFMLDIENAISANNEGTNTNSSKDYSVGEMLWLNGNLYRVIRPISAGATFIVDTNIESVSFEDLFNNFTTTIKRSITENDDGTNATATQNWHAGDWLWLDDVLYIVTNDIAEGNAYVYDGDNSNVKTTSVEKELKYEANLRETADNAFESEISTLVTNVGDLFERLSNFDCYIVPSGDTTGATDLLNIQEKLDKYNTVILSAGTFYINDSIKIKNAQYFSGLGKGNTIIRTTGDFSAFIPYSDRQSVDTNTFKDFTLLAPEPTYSTHYAFNFDFTYNGEFYQGARYCVFENIDVRYFYGGFIGSQMWNTRFTSCRFMCSNTCLRLRDAVNAVLIQQCGFTVDKYTALTQYVGVGVYTDSGSRVECTDITIDACTFELCTVGLRMSTCRNANITNNYFEKGTDAIVLDSCPQARIIGGYITGFSVLARIDNTYASYAYDGLVDISNVHMFVDSDEDKAYIIPTSRVGKVYARNIGIYNKGTGKTYMIQGDNNTYRTGNANAILLKEVFDISSLANITSKTIGLNGIGATQQFKAQRAYIVFKKTITTSSSITVTVSDDNSNVLYTFTIPSGTHNAGDRITVGPSEATIIDNAKLSVNASATITNIEADLILTGYAAEFSTPHLGNVNLPDYF